MRIGFIMTLFMASLSAVAWSADGRDPLSGFLLHADAFKPLADRNLPPEVDALEYGENELPHAYVSDLNGDALPDYLIAAHPRLCGTGGCPHILVEGKSRRTIGEFFGAIALLRQKINGFPVLQTVSKSDIDSATLSTYVFDGNRYRLTASSLLEERGMAAWKESLDREVQH